MIYYSYIILYIILSYIKIILQYLQLILYNEYYFMQAGPCSWLDMHNFIGDLMAANASVTGHPLREQRTVETPSSAWPKVSHPPQPTPSRQSQVKSAVRFGLQEREREPRAHESHGE